MASCACVSAVEATGDGIRFGLHGVAGLGHRQRPARRGAALLSDVCQLVREQGIAVGRTRSVLARCEVHVGAGVNARAETERASESAVVSVCTRTSDRSSPRCGASRSRAAGSSLCPEPLVVAMVEAMSGCTTPPGMIPSPGARPMSCPNAWLPTVDAALSAATGTAPEGRRPVVARPVARAHRPASHDRRRGD